MFWRVLGQIRRDDLLHSDSTLLQFYAHASSNLLVIRQLRRKDGCPVWVNVQGTMLHVLAQREMEKRRSPLV